jgi:hypothetical protein
MSQIQTVWQVPAREATRGWYRDGVEVDMRLVLGKKSDQTVKKRSMRTSSTPQIRELLKENSDGLTVEQIVFAVKRDKSNVKKVLRNMPDAYIDRWIPAPRMQYKAVWCVVVPPKHCPRPEGKSK